jgi:hypothetical protein
VPQAPLAQALVVSVFFSAFAEAAVVDDVESVLPGFADE